MKRGFFGIGIYEPKTIENLGTLWRSAYNFGASFIFTINDRYLKQKSDTTKAFRHIPLIFFKSLNSFIDFIPYETELIGIEQVGKSLNLKNYVHSERSIYLLGAEDKGLPKKILNKCSRIVSIDTPLCLNVAVAGSIIMFDRNNKLNN